MNRGASKRARPVDAIETFATVRPATEAAAAEGFLLALSTSCRKHQQTKHAKRKGTESWCNEEADIPDGCAEAISTLRKILPKVEQAVQALPVSVTDIGHMCDFYTSCLSGVFCPHAPHLFFLGQGATEILPRAHSLFQHLASRAVIGNTVAVAAAAQRDTASSTASGGPPPRMCSTQIATTAAQLLALCPEPVLQECILRDLIYTAMDLAVLCQSGLLQDAAGAGAATMDGPVQVLLFSETIEASPGLSDDTVYAVTIPNMDVLLSLQGATLLVLETYLALQKKDRLEPPPEDGRLIQKDPSRAPGESDLMFCGILGDNEVVSTLLGSFRQVLYATTTPDRKLRIMSLQAKETVARLLHILQQDYRKIGVPAVSLLHELAILTVNATLAHLRLVHNSQVVDSVSADSYAFLLTSLVEGLILFPPRVQGPTLHKDIEAAVARSVFRTMMECVELIKVEPLQIDSTGMVVAAKVALEAVVLRTLHALIRKIDPSSVGSPATNSPLHSNFIFSLSQKTVEQLFGFLGDHSLSDSAIWIVSSMLLPQQPSPTRWTSIDQVCQSCLQDERLELNENDTVASATSNNSKKLPGEKDKRSRFQISPLQTETPDIKRQKLSSAGGYAVAGHEARCITMSTIDQVFAEFLHCALSSAQSLARSLQEGAVFVESRNSDPSHISMLLKASDHMVAVSSAVRLLGNLLGRVSCPDARSDDCAATLNILALLLKPLSDLCRSFKDAQLKAVSSPTLIRSLVESGVKCGFHARYLAPSFPRADLGLGWKSCLESLMESADGFYCLFVDSAVNSQTILPAFLTMAAYNCAIDAHYNTEHSGIVSAFGRCVVSAEQLGAASSSASPFLCTSSFLAPLTGEVGPQQERIGLLEQTTRTQLHDSGTSLQEAAILLLDQSRDASDTVFRLLKWQALAWVFLSTEPLALRQLMTSNSSDDRTTGGSVGDNIIKWLISAAFSDPDDMVRDYASKEIGAVLSANDCIGVLAVVSQDDEWRSLLSRVGSGDARQRSVAIQASVRFFQEVDRLLHEHCRVPQSQLSFTVRTSSATRQLDGSKADPSSEKILSSQRSAMRALVAICERVDVDSTCGKVLFEQSLVRVVRLWTGLESGSRIESEGLGYGELSCLSQRAKFGEKVRAHCMESFIPGLFQDILVPSSGFLLRAAQGGIESIPPEIRERQYRLLLNFIQRFLVAEDTSNDSLFISVFDFLEECLPFVLAQLVIEKDYDALRLTTGFKLFLQSLSKAKKKVGKRKPSSAIHCDADSDLVIGDPKSVHLKTSDWTRRLERQTRDLILAPLTVERVLPHIFMRAGRAELVFFIKEVLQNKMTLKEIIVSREQLILKGLVWELGRDPDLLELAKHAIRTAASARSQDPVSTTPSSVEDPKTFVTGRPGRDSNEERDFSSAAKWVSGNFMYLLVNGVQLRWTTRSPVERVRAVRCLFYMLDFLLPSDSPQYVPQIMATVNAAVGQEWNQSETQGDRKLRIQLRLLAVQTLSKFVKLVANYHWETLGHNLTTIVVSLIPVLSDEEAGFLRSSDRNDAEVASAAAVELLEWLTQGDLGKNLAIFFKEIPFLPSSAALNKVRNSLRAHGVDFDDLHIVSTPGTQHGSLHRDSLQSDVGSMSTDTRGSSSSSRRQGALNNRIEMVCSLLSNENASIRRVVLHHLTVLLRANRELFHVLVENEGSTSMRRYVTVAYSGTSGFSRGTVTEMVDILLSRCVRENDEEARILLATCLGEVGAIAGNRLEDAKALGGGGNEAGDDSFSWRLSKPPWQSRPARYELKLVTKYLVIALKAAPTSGDQHKIAHTIQQLLVLLDNSANESNSASKPAGISSRNLANGTVDSMKSSRQEMSSWLVGKLSDAEVLDVVEPFWFSMFAEAEGFAPKQPPFFRTSSTYYQWVSSWSRYMAQRSYMTHKTKWSELFYACRTALRAQAGLGVAEFLLPILVLDRICFGDGPDESAVVQEMRDVLIFDNDATNPEGIMAHSERQKAVSTLFMIIDTLQFWSEQETEQRHRKSGGPTSGSVSEQRPNSAHSAGDEWPLDESIMRIDDILQAIPLSLRADAAAKVGMHARALRLLEMATRARVVDKIFNASPIVVKNTEAIPKPSKSRAAGTCSPSDMNLTKEVLSSLNDYETTAALEEDSFLIDPSIRVRDSIRQKEATGDWEGALQDYERAQQLDGLVHRNPLTQRGALRCMLQLGRLESVLSQVNGIMSPRASSEDLDIANAIPIAVEASWRLGRWDSLSELVEVKGASNIDSDGSYEVSLGHVMLGLHTKNLEYVDSSLKCARCALMEGLSSVARESYSRAYDHVVKLQSLREIEDAAELVCADKSVVDFGDWVGLEEGCGWDRRLDFVAPCGATTVINTRLALTRLRGDSAFEGSLFLNMGKRARKSGLYNIATNAFAQAEAAFDSIDPEHHTGLDDFSSTLRMQVAKLKHDMGESSTALRLLGQNDVERMVDLDESALRLAAINHVKRTKGTTQGSDESKIIDGFVRSVLQSTRWMIEGGLKGGTEIMGRFRIIHRLAPNWEKSHFQFAKYVDSVMQSRIMALQRRSSEDFVGADEDSVRSRTIAQDRTCQKYALLAIKHYAEALGIDLKHVYQALPRLLSLWFDFTSIGKKATESSSNAAGLGLASQVKASDLADASVSLIANQDEANAFMAKKFKQIPAQAFYTAMAQLISRIIHDDKETALVVRGILRRVLTKFPAQAMWPLAWLRQSRDTERLKIGDALFYDAERGLMKGPNQTLFKVLVASKSLFKFFQDLAKYPIKDHSIHAINIKPWKGEVELSEFIPPIQGALSISMPSQENARSRDLFPRQVPRMRAFHPKVTVMGSKARPKKLRAVVITVESRDRLGSSKTTNDIGEIHFLVKQEAKGDLRKDARVQDLNNVINRLMSSSNSSQKGSRNRGRHLHLRTFAVTCLSEETGLLEWVPKTESLRSLVCNSYNPQASPFSSKRRGRRLANFGDPMLRNNFEKKCQEMYFKTGNLTRAAALFEQLCLKPYPPLLYWWFVQKYHDPHAWYEARTRFTLSAAAWSAVGHVIGLGDRHSDNILVDTSTGECVHVDFDCIFDKGLNLPKPEVVPFRLTQNMLDAFGPAGADGIYSGSLQAAMGVLRDNRDTLLSVLEPFLKDPVIDWKRYRSQQKSRKGGSTEDRQTKEAKRSINVIDERLKGIYNLRNPNHQKIRRTDGLSMDQQDDEQSHLLPLSVEGQVHKMIAEATSVENLVQLYVGWMPWV